jgi:GntR family transcriptional repressor for pyruvate dehydrogenase complex
VTMFHAVRTRRTFEEAVQQIADAIRAGDLRTGDRLPSERALAAQMEISRPTLREAIKILSEAGVVDSRVGGGTFVKSETIPADLLEARSTLRVGEVAQVLEARRLLEPRVAQLAGLYATEDDLERMQKLIDAQRELSGDRERVRVLDTRFHLAIARATRNDVIVQQMRLLLGHVEIARDMALRTPLEPGLIVATHERTLAAIIGGDADEIDAAMDEHLSYLERMWEDESGRPRLRRPPAFLVSRTERS